MENCALCTRRPYELGERLVFQRLLGHESDGRILWPHLRFVVKESETVYHCGEIHKAAVVGHHTRASLKDAANWYFDRSAT